MSVSRLKYITKIGVEEMGDLADSLEDPEVLRLENLDTDMRPPKSALDFTKQAVDDDDSNSYLPFFGLEPLRQAAAKLVEQSSGQEYDWKTQCIISAGGLSGILNLFFAHYQKNRETKIDQVGRPNKAEAIHWGSARGKRVLGLLVWWAVRAPGAWSPGTPWSQLSMGKRRGGGEAGKAAGG